MADISGELILPCNVLVAVSGENNFNLSLELAGRITFVHSLMPQVSGELTLRQAVVGVSVAGELVLKETLYERDEVSGDVTLRLRMLDTSMGTTYPLYHFDKTHGL